MKASPTPVISLLPIVVLLAAVSAGFSSDDPEFKSELFKAGTLVYSDDFDGELNRERWGAPKGKKRSDQTSLLAQLVLAKASGLALKMNPILLM